MLIPRSPGLLGKDMVEVLKHATDFLTPLPSRDGLYFLPSTWSGLVMEARLNDFQGWVYKGYSGLSAVKYESSALSPHVGSPSGDDHIEREA